MLPCGRRAAMRATVWSMREWMPSVSAVPLPRCRRGAHRSRPPANARRAAPAQKLPPSIRGRGRARSPPARHRCRAAGSARSRSKRKRTRPASSISAIQLSSFCLASASITGPTWVASSRGSPNFQFARRADQHVEHRLGDVLLQAQQPQRRAALAGGAEGRRDRRRRSPVRAARWRRRSWR